MTSLQESYIDCKLVYGNSESAEIYKIVRVWQDDGGEEDFYLILNDMNNNFFNEIHIQDYLDGYTIEKDNAISTIIWLDTNNNIDEDYFELVLSIENIKTVNKEEEEFIDFINKVYQNAINKNNF